MANTRNEDQLVDDLYRCYDCNKIFKHLQSLVVHIEVKHLLPTPRSCPYCNKIFPHMKNLQTHMLVVHRKGKTFTCEFCKKGFKTHYGLKCHMVVHDVGEKFFCNVCNRKFLYRSSLNTHVKSHKAKRETLVSCKICDKSYTKSRYIIHKNRKHATKRYTCFICYRRFTCLSLLNRHVYIHTGEGDFFTCPVCYKKYKSYAYVKLHMSSHTGEKRYQCNVCNKYYRHPSTLHRHIRQHQECQPYSCGLCLKSFSQATALKRHLETHLTAKYYSCTECKRVLKSQRNLNEHLKLHHTENLYGCNICFKKYKSEELLRCHKKIHNKKYVCGVCGRKFMAPVKLKNHIINVHKAKRNRETAATKFCNICNKSFQRLDSHMKKHKNNMVFKCEICDITYNSVKSAQDLCSHFQDKLPRCKLCQKIFMSQTSLNLHLKMHFQETLPSCKLCHKIFKIETYLNQHLKRHRTKDEKGAKIKSQTEYQKCNKEFSDTHSYKQHIESDDSNKQFRCEYCHERFYSFTSLYKHLGKHNG